MWVSLCHRVTVSHNKPQESRQRWLLQLFYDTESDTFPPALSQPHDQGFPLISPSSQGSFGRPGDEAGGRAEGRAGRQLQLHVCCCS